MLCWNSTGMDFSYKQVVCVSYNFAMRRSLCDVYKKSLNLNSKD